MNDDQKNYWQPDENQPNTDQPQFQDDSQSDSVSETEPTIQSDVETTDQESVIDDTPITWTAQEYVHLDKNGWWYVVFAVVVIGLIAVDVLLLKSWTFSILVVVMAVAVIVYIRRPPRMLTYALSAKQGLYVGEKLYHFDEFKAFGLIQDADNHSIMLIPRKRFAPGVSVFFPEEAGERIVDILGQRLPMKELKLDVIDVLVRKLRL